MLLFFHIYIINRQSQRFQARPSNLSSPPVPQTRQTYCSLSNFIFYMHHLQQITQFYMSYTHNSVNA